MATPQPLADPEPQRQAPPTLYSPTQEVRFAVVMFGGVSLAVYMNGIAQELMRMVQATAPESAHDPQRFSQRPMIPDDALGSTLGVYRTVGKMLAHGRQVPARLAEVEREPGAPILTRFVIDILAGTSAGGINSVYLAKALVNNQDLGLLEGLWKDQGDIDLLLNDRRSGEGSFATQGRKRSLLNSRRMYHQLFEAFQKMDEQGGVAEGGRSLLVDELDLFVTATDLHGLWAPVKTSDRMIEERVHKTVFRFRYSPDGHDRANDFQRRHNGMLAFAARCTSSFPVAFEPMRLEDVTFIPELSQQQLGDRPWRAFFRRYLVELHGDPDYHKRPFADGGYLQNKPFSHALQAIRFRDAWGPVDRKLLFLDPFPELRELAPRPTREVSFVENLVKAASSLPRYQTIREDLEAINARNRKLYRVHVLSRKLLEPGNGLGPRWGSLSARQFRDTDLDTLVNGDPASGLEPRGAAFASYFYQRVYDVTDELALLVTRLLGLPEDSDYVRAVRHLVRAWRDATYVANRPGPGQRRETEFLLEFDVGYRQRRIEFLLGRIDAELEGRRRGQESEEPWRLRCGLRLALRELRNRRDALWSPWEDEPASGPPVNPEEQRQLRAALVGLDISTADLERVMAAVSEDECFRRARTLMDEGRRAAVERLAKALAEHLRAAYVESKRLMDEVLPDPDAREVTELQRRLRETSDRFDHYDSLMYAALANLAAGERDLVETYRIGPADASRVNPLDDPGGRRKLAGTALFDFGAFLRRSWRENDIMWGRLDGAERILHALLPGDEPGVVEDRTRLIDEAHRVIIDETFVGQRQEQLHALLASFLRDRGADADLAAEAAEGHPKAREAAARIGEHRRELRRKRDVDGWLEWLRKELDERDYGYLDRLIRNALDSRAKVDLFRRAYSRPAPPETPVSLKRLRRSLAIFGDMLQGLGDEDSLAGRLGRRLGKVGPAFGYLLELLLPEGRLARWMNSVLLLLLAVSAILLFGAHSLQVGARALGWVFLGGTIALGLVTAFVRRAFARGRG